MMKQIKTLFTKYRQIIIYGMCSVFTCILELIIGYVAKNSLGMELIFANSIGIFVGAVVHYLLISYKAFHRKASLWNLFVYVITFILGFVLQNLVMKVFYEYVFFMLLEIYRYTGSKLASVAIPFFFVYFVRRYLYSIKFNKNSSLEDK